MRTVLLGFAGGALLLQSQAALPSFPVLLLLVAVGLACCLLARRRRARLRLPLHAAAGLLLGFAWAGGFAQYYLSQELAKEWEGRDIAVVGVVDSLPMPIERGLRFNFRIEHALVAETGADTGRPVLPRTVALSWYSAFRADQFQALPELKPGERWQLNLRLRRPHGNANPDGFDYEAWLLEQNVRATGSVVADEQHALKNRRLGAFVFSPGAVVERSRGWLRERILTALVDKPYASVIVALVIGDQRAVSQSDWKVFNRTGIGHLISISGLHITMIAGLCAALVSLLWRRSFFTNAELPLRLPAQKAAALAGAASALVYVLLAGFGVPAQRTLYMLSIVAAALWCGRITSVSHVLCAALGVVVLLDPWAVLWPGFWLSFGAVALILYASVGRVSALAPPSARSRWHGLKAGAYIQYVLTLGLVPLTMLLFGQISLVSPLANAVAIPLVSFFVTPLALLGSVLPAPLSNWLLLGAHFLIEQLAAVLGWLSALPLAVWAAPLPAWWIFALGLLGVLWLLTPAGWPARWLGACCLLPLALNGPAHPAENEMWITAFDIGQGMALLVETPKHRLLYDTGPAYSPESDAGSRVILPYLKARGIHRLDGIIVSHSDADHAGGALTLLDEIEVGWVSSSLPSQHAIVAAAREHRRCEAGQGWEWDGVRFDMLNPAAVSYDSAKWKPNARSCTLKVTLGKHAMLLSGDIEAVQEAELVESAPDRLRAAVLLAPHHGSGTSSTLPFLQAVAPQVALFQVGYLNRYHHPKPEIYERYGELGVRRLRSDEAGAVLLRFGTEIEVAEYRQMHARYWYAR